MLNTAMMVHGLGGMDLALAIDRVAVGAFFAFSGFHKLFNAQRHAAMRQTLERDKVPLVKVNEWWVPFWEFTAGSCVLFGIMAGFMASVLCIICAVACMAEAKGRIQEYKPIDKLDWWDDLLYLPEVLYILMLLPTVAGGAGPFSIDGIL